MARTQEEHEVKRLYAAIVNQMILDIEKPMYIETWEEIKDTLESDWGKHICSISGVSATMIKEKYQIDQKVEMAGKIRKALKGSKRRQKETEINNLEKQIKKAKTKGKRPDAIRLMFELSEPYEELCKQTYKHNQYLASKHDVPLKMIETFSQGIKGERKRKEKATLFLIAPESIGVDNITLRLPG